MASRQSPGELHQSDVTSTGTASDGDDNQLQSSREWFEKLYPPLYTVDDWMQQTCSSEDSSSAAREKNIYYRVWKEMFSGEHPPDTTTGGDRSKKDNQQSTTTIQQHKAVMVREESVWTTEEIGVIRRFVAHLRAREQKATAVAKELIQRNEEVERKVVRLNRDLQREHARVHEVTSANTRFYLLTNALADQNRQGQSFCSQVEKDALALYESNRDLRRRLKEKENQLITQETTLTKLQKEVDIMKVDRDGHVDRAVTAALAPHLMENAELQRKVQQLERSLQREREESRAYQTALGQILQHYSSVPETGSTSGQRDPILQKIVHEPS